MTPRNWSQWPQGLKGRPWSLGRWDRGFESRLRHVCLSSSIHHYHSPITLSSTLFSSYWESVVK
jgi:hypothetical protein